MQKLRDFSMARSTGEAGEKKSFSLRGNLLGTRLPRSARYRIELWKSNVGELPKNNLPRNERFRGLVAARRGEDPRNACPNKK